MHLIFLRLQWNRNVRKNLNFFTNICTWKWTENCFTSTPNELHKFLFVEVGTEQLNSMSRQKMSSMYDKINREEDDGTFSCHRKLKISIFFYLTSSINFYSTYFYNEKNLKKLKIAKNFCARHLFSTCYENVSSINFNK